MSPILQNQICCGKDNDDTKGKKFKVSGTHDTSEISIQQFSFGENSCPSWLDLGGTTSMGYCKYFQQQMAAPVAGGVSFIHTRQEQTSWWITDGFSFRNIPRNLAEAPLSLTAPFLKSQNWRPRGYQSYTLSTFSCKSPFEMGFWQLTHTHCSKTAEHCMGTAAAQAGKGCCQLPHASRRSPLRLPENRRNTNFLIATQQSWILAQK